MEKQSWAHEDGYTPQFNNSPLNIIQAQKKRMFFFKP